MNSPEELTAKKEGVVIAAGGIVERGEIGKKEILIIKRERYGEEWCLPKGKQIANESIEETALREVKEETSCSAKITGFANLVHYPVDENMKVVFFWRMEVEKKEEFKKTEEVKEVKNKEEFKETEEVKEIKWMTPAKAWKELSHENEKNLIVKLFLKSDAPESLYGKLVSGINNKWHMLTHIQSRGRLRHALTTYGEELNRRISEIKPSANPQWAVSALNLLDEANRTLESSHPNHGWACFHAARRMEILSFDKTDLENLAKIIRGEAQKLTQWRQETIHALIGSDKEGSDPSVPTKTLTNSDVWWSAQLRDEHFTNQYFKISLRRVNLIWVFVFLVSTISLMFLFDFLGLLPPFNRPMIIASAFLGLLGALLSVAFTLSKSSIDKGIPDQILGSFITWMRPVIGAVSGMVTYIFVKAGLFDGFVAAKLTEDAGIFVLAFVSGFSERFIVRAIDKVAENKAAKN